MFVPRLIFILGLSLFFISCSTNKKLVSTTSFKGDIILCNSKSNQYKFFYRKDSLQSSLKLYSDLGIKIVDIILTKDSTYVLNAINSDIEKNIDFYLKKYHSKICIENVISDFFSKKILSDSAYCYRIEKIDDPEKRNFYNIYTLDQERIITVENVFMSGNKSEYRIFNESFCVQLNLK